jgi:hypothetical protein
MTLRGYFFYEMRANETGCTGDKVSDAIVHCAIAAFPFTAFEAIVLDIRNLLPVF